jgi:hypothetical protein
MPVAVDARPAGWLPQARTNAPDHLGETDVTHRVRRAAPSLGGGLLKSKLALPLGIVAVAGIALGAYLALRTSPAAAPVITSKAAPVAADVAAVAAPVAAPIAAPVAAPIAAPTVTAIAPAAAPTVTAIAPIAAAPIAIAAAPIAGAPVQVHFESTPAGANVMLVDNGESAFLGATPVNRTLDPTHTYYAVFTSADHPPQVAAIDAHKSQNIAIDLRVAPAIAPTPAAPVAHVATTPAPAATTAPAAPKHTATKSAVATDVAVSHHETAAPASGFGLLMISSKPPCSILIDGKPTGLMTPQRAMKLPAGTHHIGFVNAHENINRSFRMDVPAGKTSKIIEDLTTK